MGPDVKRLRADLSLKPLDDWTHTDVRRLLKAHNQPDANCDKFSRVDGDLLFARFESYNRDEQERWLKNKGIDDDDVIVLVASTIRQAFKLASRRRSELT